MLEFQSCISKILAISYIISRWPSGLRGAKEANKQHSGKGSNLRQVQKKKSYF